MEKKNEPSDKRDVLNKRYLLSNFSSIFGNFILNKDEIQQCVCCCIQEYHQDVWSERQVPPTSLQRSDTYTNSPISLTMHKGSLRLLSFAKNRL